MKVKRLVIGVMLGIFLMGLTGCELSGQGKKRPEVTLTVKVPTLTMECISNPEVTETEKFVTLAAEKFVQSYTDADVTIKVEVFDYVDEKKAIVDCFGTKEAVDVLYEGYFNMSSYVSSGYVVPLDDIISQELRQDISENTWNQSMKNGKTYMMPFLSMQNILIYNKSLFLECGLEQFISEEAVIHDWTLEEWELILDTLAERLPTGSYPMVMYAMNNQGDTHIMSLIRAFGSNIFDEDGNFNFEGEEAVRGLKWIQDGVSRGWYAPHAENIELADNHQLFKNGQLGIYLFNNANFALYGKEIENFGFVNFPGGIATSFVTGFEVFDNGDPERVRVAKDFVKFIYDTEELMDLSAGNLPESKKVAEKFGDQIELLAEFTENRVNVVDFMNSSPNWQGQDNSVRSVFWPHIHELLAGRITPEECARGLDRDCNAAIHVEGVPHE